MPRFPPPGRQSHGYSRAPTLCLPAAATSDVPMLPPVAQPSCRAPLRSPPGRPTGKQTCCPFFAPFAGSPLQRALQTCCLPLPLTFNPLPQELATVPCSTLAEVTDGHPSSLAAISSPLLQDLPLSPWLVCSPSRMALKADRDTNNHLLPSPRPHRGRLHGSSCLGTYLSPTGTAPMRPHLPWELPPGNSG